MYEAYVTALADMFYPSAASAASGDPAPYSAACVSRAFHGWEAPSAGVAGCPPRSRPSCARSARTWISASRARGRRFATRAWEKRSCARSSTKATRRWSASSPRRWCSRFLARWPLRRRGAGAAAQVASQEEGVQPGLIVGAGRSRRDKRNRIGYTKSRAQQKGSGRALGGPAAGQRRRRLQGQRTSQGQNPPHRRRLHPWRDHERLRNNPTACRRAGSPRFEFV